MSLALLRLIKSCIYTCVEMDTLAPFEWKADFAMVVFKDSKYIEIILKRTMIKQTQRNEYIKNQFGHRRQEACNFTKAIEVTEDL